MKKKYEKHNILIFLENKTVICFLIPDVLQPFGLFSWYNGVNASSVFLFSIEVPEMQMLVLPNISLNRRGKELCILDP